MKIHLSVLFVLLAGALRAEEIRLLTTPEEGCFTILGATATDKCVILSDANEAEVVGTVIECLKSDIKTVSRKAVLSYNTLP